MAYNLLAVTQSAIEWRTVSDQYQSTDRLFEIFPIADPQNGDAIGISIPTNHFNAKTWQSAARFLRTISAAGPLTVYDMYQGSAIELATYVPDELRGS